MCEYEKNDNSGRYYNFSFILKLTYENLENRNHWFKVSDILDLPFFDESRLDDDDFIEKLDNIVSSMGIEDSFKRESLKT